MIDVVFPPPQRNQDSTESDDGYYDINTIELLQMTNTTGYTSLLLQLMHMTGLLIGVAMRADVDLYLHLPRVFLQILGNDTSSSTEELMDNIESRYHSLHGPQELHDIAVIVETMGQCLNHGVAAIYPQEAAALLTTQDSTFILHGWGGSCLSVQMLRASAIYDGGIMPNDRHI